MGSLNEASKERIHELFYRAAFVRDLGMELDGLGSGWCETSLVLQPRHLQQDGFVHAGVVSTLADHTGGGAGWTSTADGETVLSVEFKIAFLRPAKGERLRCRAEVLRAGRSLIFTEAMVSVPDGETQKPVAKLTQTLAVVDAAVGGGKGG